MSINYYISHDKDNLCILYSKIGVLPKVVSIDPNDGNGYMRYLLERTCYLEELDSDGYPVPQSVYGDGYCGYCDGIIDFEDKYCKHCGAKVIN